MSVSQHAPRSLSSTVIGRDEEKVSLGQPEQGAGSWPPSSELAAWTRSARHGVGVAEKLQGMDRELSFSSGCKRTVSLKPGVFCLFWVTLNQTLAGTYLPTDLRHTAQPPVKRNIIYLDHFSEQLAST